MHLGDVDHVLGVLADALVAVRSHGNDPAAAGGNLLDVGERLLVERPLGGQHHHRQAGVDQGDGAVLHLAGGIGLGVDVADLLELEGPFVGRGRLEVATQEQKVGGLVVLLGHVSDRRAALQRFLYQPRQLAQLAQQLAGAGLVQGAAGAPQPDGQHFHCRQHGYIGLGGSHSNLGAGVDEQVVVGLAGDRRALDVDHAQAGRAAPLGLAQRLEGVDRLTRLTDDDGQRPLVYHRVAVAVLAGHVHLHRQPRQLFDQVLAHPAGIEGGAAGDDVDAVEAARVEVEPQLDVRLLFVQAAAQGVFEHPGLFVDLLEHVVGVAALFGRLHVPVDLAHLAFDRVALEVHHSNVVFAYYGHVPVVQEDDPAGVGE